MNILTDKQNQKLALSFFIGVCVGVLSLWMWTATQSALTETPRQQQSVTEKEAGSQTATVKDFDTGSTRLESDVITVRNQNAGTRVVVDNIILEEDGWVVIHEGTVSQIGNALGAARFDKGEHSGVVELLRSTVSGEMYRAVLYRDNGDRIFSLDNDFPFLQNGNQPVLTTFIAL
ncbi:hypothetical protein HYW58_03185 [Candidatus Kaiserbacteria bacterium]|nr:hypothetical protein [Candidatus Kaiserbacteria bacterium]